MTKSKIQTLTEGKPYITDLSNNKYGIGLGRCEVCEEQEDLVQVRPEPEEAGWPMAFDCCKPCVRTHGKEIGGRPGRYEF